jgi:lambda family phage portal protein
MNALDSLVSVISPRWGLSRARARVAIQAYKAARPSRLHKAAQTHASADSRVEWAGRSLRGQARYLEESSDLVDGLITTLVNNVVGKDGIGVEPMPLNYAGEVDESFARQLLDGFSEWSLKCESTGQFSRPEIERLVCRTWLRDGECLGEQLLGNVPGFKHPNKDVPFSLQVMEPDFLPFDLTRPDDLIVQGIERNQWGQPQNYHVYLSHPGDMGSFNMKTRAISSERMLHIKLVKRLHQGRGVSVLASSLSRISGLDNYEESELVAARIAAAMAFYIKKGLPEDYEEFNGNPRQHLPISPGTIFDDLKPGEDVGTIESKRPNSLMQKFRDTMVRAICSATGANFSTVAKQYDGTYSSQRQELVESYLSYGVLSNAFIAQWSRPVYRRWVQMAIMSGQVQVPYDVDQRTIFLAYYQPPVMPWIDPAKEANGHTTIVAGGFGTESEVIRSRGKNPQEVKRQRAREIRENRELGLVFTSDAYHKFYGTADKDEDDNDNDNKKTDESRRKGDGDDAA